MISSAEAQRTTVALLGDLVDRLPVAMLITREDGPILVANALLERLFGYNRDEIIGQAVEVLVPDRYRGGHPGMRKGFFSAPRARPMGAGRDLYARRKDGSEFPVEIALNPVQSDAGTVVLGAIVDITERKRLEERFRAVVESAPTAMVMIDRAGAIVLVNAQTEALFGYARAELMGQGIEALVPERFRGGHPSHREAFFADPQARRMGAGRDLHGLRKDGSEFPVEIGLNPIETAEGHFVLGAIVDITERRQREARIQGALREKELLLGEVHHRVKNNLQVIHSLLDMQSYRVTDPGAAEMLRESRNRVKSMALIHQTLYQSHDFEDVDFERFLGLLLPELMHSYQARPESVRLEVRSNNVQLPINAAIPCGLVVNELVANALKHGFPAGRTGRIAVELAQESPDIVRLSVSNDGEPIPELLDIENAPTLGLQLVRLLAEQLGAEFHQRRAGPTQFSLRFNPRGR